MPESTSQTVELFFNGIRGDSGTYGLNPMSGEELAQHIVESWASEDLTDLGLQYQQRGSALRVVEGVDPRDLAQAGWGVLFAYDTDPSLKEKLKPLLELRRSQAGSTFHLYERSEGYRPGETAARFLARHGARMGEPADPKKVPYYLLLVGSPGAIPYHFQYQLSTQYAVGRLHFDRLPGYASYARSVVAAETGDVTLRPKAAFFGVSQPDDRVTDISANYLVEPLYHRIAERYGDRWQVDMILREEATKTRLRSLLGGEETPAFLLTACHGMEFGKADPDGRQARHQGALLCQDWPGPSAGGSQVPPDVYLAGEDLTGNANLLGMIAFFYATYSAGTPRFDEFTKQAFKESGVTITDRPFVASLPKAMLSQSIGSALAVVGLVERAWSVSFVSPRFDEQTAVWSGVIERLLHGHPIGSAMEYFAERYASLALELDGRLEESKLGKSFSPYELVEIWTQMSEARGLVINGDPAVRLPVAEYGETPTGRRALEIEPEAEPTAEAELLAQAGAIGGASNDQVAERDQLNFQNYVTAFADLIASTHTSPPLTIGIFGSWGMGKSFLLKHIKRELESRAGRNQVPVHTVEFDAWEYNANEEIWPGLVRQIMQELEHCIPRNLRNKKLRDRIWRNFKSKLLQERERLIVFSIATMVVLVLIAVTVWQLGGNLSLLWTAVGVLGLGGVLGLIKEIRDAISEPLSPWITALFKEDSGYGKPIDYMTRIRQDLEFLGEGLGDDRVLVLIDDLDRCEPEKAVEVLQAIKLLLDFEHFIVCLGIDARVVTRAVEKYYKDLLGPAGASGYEYLDKIVQIPFRIPTPTPEEIGQFISKQMDDPQPPADFVPPGPRPPAATEPTPEPTTVPGPGTGPDPSSTPGGEPVDTTSPEPPPDAEPEAGEAFTYYELLAFENLTRFLRPNPRHIKRLLNVYRLVRSLAKLRDQQFILTNPTATIRWLVLCSQWPYVAHEMLRFYGEMLEDEAEATEDTPFEWPSTDPLLHLYDQVQGALQFEKQAKLDHDPDLLRQLLNLEEGCLSWGELRIIRQYTINFNPAVEAELRSGAADGAREPEQEAQDTQPERPSRPSSRGQSEKNIGLADQIRQYVLQELVGPARSAGQGQLTIRAGDVHSTMGLKNRMPAVCGALDAAKFYDQAGVTLVTRSGPKRGANAKWDLSL